MAMSEISTVARPYAKAAFGAAKSAQQIAEWSTQLKALASMFLDEQAQVFLVNPTVNAEKQVSFLTQMLNAMGLPKMEGVVNLIDLLAKHKRLAILPDICVQYEAFRAEQEKTLVAHVRTYEPLTPEQTQRLIDALSKRLQRQVSLEITVDSSLMGGAIIQVADLGIDGSVVGKLQKLRDSLAA